MTTMAKFLLCKDNLDIPPIELREIEALKASLFDGKSTIQVGEKALLFLRTFITTLGQNRPEQRKSNFKSLNSFLDREVQILWNTFLTNGDSLSIQIVDTRRSKLSPLQLQSSLRPYNLKGLLDGVPNFGTKFTGQEEKDRALLDGMRGKSNVKFVGIDPGTTFAYGAAALYSNEVTMCAIRAIAHTRCTQGVYNAKLEEIKNRVSFH